MKACATDKQNSILSVRVLITTLSLAFEVGGLLR
jgi:hypothetical protein